jgi:predicted lipoprotein with Yx(FWY)xxD motif
MSVARSRGRAHRGPWTALTLVVALAAVGAVAVAAMAGAKSFTLRVAKNVHVTNAAAAKFAVKPVNTDEAVAVGPSGFAVYTFQGETTHHLICQKTSNPKTNCWAFWPPVSVTSTKGISKQSGIPGKLGTFHNHGTLQLTLNGQPLYYFTPDIMSGHKHQANGDELDTFGSIWHVVKAAGTSTAAPRQTGGTATNPYPPGY